MKNKLCLAIGILLVMMLIVMPKISALGISPGATTMQFEPGLEKNVTLDVINSEGKEMQVLLVVEGKLREYITLDTDSLNFSQNEKRKSFTYTLKLPGSLSPGKYITDIIAIESAESKKGGTVVGVSLSVVSKLEVYSPYPDKYAEIDLEIIEAPQNETIRFFAPVINRGQKEISNAKVTIDIYSKDKKIGSVESEQVSLKALERKELILSWLADAPQGKYKAIAKLEYDGQTAEIEKEFNVGEMVLDIVYIYVKDFQLGGIAQFNILLDNKWDSELKGVYFNMLVYNKEGGVLAEFKSPTKESLPTGRTEMSSYWDTEKVKAGSYDAKLELRYGDRKTERNLELTVEENEIIIKGIAGYAVVKGEGGYITKKTFAIIIVVLLLIIGILLFVIKVIVKKKSEKVKKGGKGVEIVKT